MPIILLMDKFMVNLNRDSRNSASVTLEKNKKRRL